jgi:hypothetical protein
VERIARAVVVQGVTAGQRLLSANGEQPSFPPLFRRRNDVRGGAPAVTLEFIASARMPDEERFATAKGALRDPRRGLDRPMTAG